MESVDKTKSKDCFTCRMVGGIGCTGASLYVAYLASKNTHILGRSLSFLFAGVLGGIGLVRLLNLVPRSLS